MTTAVATECQIWSGKVNSKGYPIRIVDKVKIRLDHLKLAQTLPSFTVENAESFVIHNTCGNAACLSEHHLKAFPKATVTIENLGLSTSDVFALKLSMRKHGVPLGTLRQTYKLSMSILNAICNCELPNISI